MDPDTPISSAFASHGMQWALYVITAGAVLALCATLMGSLLPQLDTTCTSGTESCVQSLQTKTGIKCRRGLEGTEYPIFAVSLPVSPGNPVGDVFEGNVAETTEFEDEDEKDGDDDDISLSFDTRQVTGDLAEANVDNFSEFESDNDEDDEVEQSEDDDLDELFGLLE